VEIVVGEALTTLPGIDGPFDLAFVDADKQSNPEYLEHTLRLVRPGGVLVFDNVVRNGAILDAASGDARVQGLRRFFALLRDDPRVDGVALQTVGSKGWDGFALAVVAAPG
jgi:predicted O-methyltransferase YrrM